MRKHKVLTFLLSLLVAVGLWVYAVTVVNPDDTLEISDIRVRVTGTSSLAADGLMLTSSDVQYVDVEIAGRRSDLKELNSSTLEAVANVSNIDKAGTYEVSWTLNPPATVASGDISLVSASSNRITVQVSECWNREIPLEVEYTEGKPAEGYLRRETSLDEKYVTVSGPAEEVGEIARAVVTIDLTDADSKIDDDFAYRLLDENGEELTMSDFVTVSSETVHITVSVRPYKDVPLTVELIDGGGLTSTDVQSKIELLDDEGLTAATGTDRLSIRVTGSEEALANVPDTIPLQVDLAEIDGVETLVVPQTYQFPNGVERLDEPTSQSVDVNITVSLSGFDLLELDPKENISLEVINGKADRDYNISRFYADGKEVETIVLRGRLEEIEKLREALQNGKMVTVRVDLSASDQSKRHNLTVEVPEDYAVSVWQEYSVELEVTAVEPPIIPEE